MPFVLAALFSTIIILLMNLLFAFFKEALQMKSLRKFYAHDEKREQDFDIGPLDKNDQIDQNDKREINRQRQEEAQQQ
jgi:uncharacterized membrane protein YhiD involved in acid resistance